MGSEASHYFNRARSDEVAEGSNPSSAAKIKEPPFGRFFYFAFPGRIRTGAVSENMPVACFPRDPASAAAEVESFLRCHKSTLILIESGYFSFLPKTSVLLGFSEFKADLGVSRDRPFLCLCGFYGFLPVFGFVGILDKFVGILGRFVGI